MDQIAAAAETAAADAEVAFCTLGTGQPSKVSKEELWKVDVEYVAEFSAACRKGAVRHMSLLSSVDANPDSRIYYLKVKGEAEKRITDQGFTRSTLFRPSLISTPSARYGFSDAVAQAVWPRLSWVMPARYRAIQVADLGKAMQVNAERPAAGVVEILTNSDFRALLRQSK